MEKSVFAVEGMMCSGCASNVENALTGLNGVMNAKADLKEKEVTVEYDETAVNPEKMAAAVKAAGYKLMA